MEARYSDYVTNSYETVLSSNDNETDTRSDSQSNGKFNSKFKLFILSFYIIPYFSIFRIK